MCWVQSLVNMYLISDKLQGKLKSGAEPLTKAPHYVKHNVKVNPKEK